MKKKSKDTKKWTSKKKVIVVSIVLLASALLVLGASIGTAVARYYNDAATQASMVQIREVILLAVDNLKKDVPVEPKTGDLYFPESKLYLPNPKTLPKLTYAWYPGDDVTNEELSVSLLQIPGINGLYNARNHEEMFEALPKLQSCSRGVKLTYQELPHDADPKNELKHEKILQNGKKLYVYLEETCPELNHVAELLRSIQSY